MTWEVDKLWRREWPSYKVHLRRWWYDLRARAWIDLSHSTINLFVEFFRAFAYTLGHLLPACLLLYGLYKASPLSGG